MFFFLQQKKMTSLQNFYQKKITGRWEFFFYDQQIDQKVAPPPSDFFPTTVLENSISPKILVY